MLPRVERVILCCVVNFQVWYLASSAYTVVLLRGVLCVSKDHINGDAMVKHFLLTQEPLSLAVFIWRSSSFGQDRQCWCNTTKSWRNFMPSLSQQQRPTNTMWFISVTKAWWHATVCSKGHGVEPMCSRDPRNTSWRNLTLLVIPAPVVCLIWNDMVWRISGPPSAADLTVLSWGFGMTSRTTWLPP